MHCDSLVVSGAAFGRKDGRRRETGGALPSFLVGGPKHSTHPLSPPPPPSPQLTPRGEYVLAAVASAESKTTSGVLLPTSAQKAPTSGDVVAVGAGAPPRKAAGGAAPVPLDLKPGDTILYSKFGLGATDLKLGGKDHILIRASDVIGTLPRSGATAADIPALAPAADRVLLKVTPAAGVTAGGVVLPDSAKEKPVAGVVVRTGPGKRDEETGERVAPKVKEGDRVLYFKWAGDAMETPSGDAFVVLHESDILCKA